MILSCRANLQAAGIDPKAEAVKKALVEDLTGELLKQKGWGRSRRHVEKYSSYLKSFAMLRGNDLSWVGLVAAARRLYDPT
jgi:hypothetical protein